LAVRHSAAPTVLLVEDSDDTRLLLRSFLESKGYSVIEAADGREGVEAARRHHPDLVVMDLDLPALDGLSATEQILRCGADCWKTPVIAVTAHDTYGIREAALGAGCCEYLTKPLDFEHMGRTISLILGA
jgi:two-component system, cell cycle response regulator DivK